MSKNNVLTHHAVARLTQRTRMKAGELLDMLDAGACVNLGSKPGIGKEHKLFYSDADGDCFVAVQDAWNGDIISIWPTEYQENLMGPVTQDNCVKAKAERLHWVVNKNALPPHEKRWTHWKIKVQYRRDGSGYAKQKNLLSLAREDKGSDLNAFMAQELTPTKLVALAKEKSVEPNSIIWLGVFQGKKLVADFEGEGL